MDFLRDFWHFFGPSPSWTKVLSLCRARFVCWLTPDGWCEVSERAPISGGPSSYIYIMIYLIFCETEINVEQYLWICLYITIYLIFCETEINVERYLWICLYITIYLIFCETEINVERYLWICFFLGSNCWFLLSYRLCHDLVVKINCDRRHQSSQNEWEKILENIYI